MVLLVEAFFLRPNSTPNEFVNPSRETIYFTEFLKVLWIAPEKD